MADTPKMVLLVKTGVEVCILGPFENMGLALAHAVSEVDPLGLAWEAEPIYPTLRALQKAVGHG